jgi:hypothetical protein
MNNSEWCDALNYKRDSKLERKMKKVWAEFKKSNGGTDQDQDSF